MRGKILLVVRRMHLYLSVFFAPLLLLFVVTGWAQTVGFSRQETPTVLERLTAIHKSDYYPTEVNRSKSFKIAGKSEGNRMAALESPMRWLVVGMCVALLVSISLGLVLAFTMVRNRVPVWIALTLGVATPVVLLALAHFR